MTVARWSRKRVSTLAAAWVFLIIGLGAWVVSNRVNRGINRYYFPKPGEPRHSTEDDTTTAEVLGLLGTALLPPIGLTAAWLASRRKDQTVKSSQADA